MRDKRKTAGIYLVLTILALLTLAPLAFLLINSFKSQAEIVDDPLALPGHFTLEYLVNAAQTIQFPKALALTIFTTVVSVGLLVIISSFVAWMMVRTKSRASKALYLAFSAAMLIPFQSVMYPLIELFDGFGLKNLGGLIIMYCGFGMCMSVFMYHGFIKNIPLSLEEAAVIDGASIFQLFFKVVFPLLRTTTVTVIIINTMWIWNDYLLPYLVIGNAENKTLTLELYYAKQIVSQYGNPWELIFPAVLISILPVVVLFLLLQKQVMTGMTDGAVKG